MKRILLFLTLVVIGLSCISASGSEGRDFITGFFQTVKGKDWKLNENCFGPAVDADLVDLKAAIQAFEFNKALEILSKIAVESKADCPVEEFLELQNLVVEKAKSGELLKNIQKNFLEIIRLVKENLTNPEQRTPYNFGKTLGSIALLVLYNKQHNRALTFLADNDSLSFLAADEMNTEQFQIFFHGILTGVSTVPYADNKCYKETDVFLIDIEAASRKVYEAIINKSPSDFYNAAKGLLAALKKIAQYDENCKASDLIKSIGVYALPYIGLGKLIYNVTVNGSTYFGLTKEMYSAISDKSYEKAGITTGKILKTLLSWETK